MLKVIRVIVLFYIAFVILHSVVPPEKQGAFWDLYSLVQHLWR
jgi:hypothetical protein